MRGLTPSHIQSEWFWWLVWSVIVFGLMNVYGSSLDIDQSRDRDGRSILSPGEIGLLELRDD
jgi:hypothetical protein